MNHRDERRIKSIEALIERKIVEHPLPEHLLSIAEVRHEKKPDQNRNNRNRKKRVWKNNKPTNNNNSQ